MLSQLKIELQGRFLVKFDAEVESFVLCSRPFLPPTTNNNFQVKVVSLIIFVNLMVPNHWGQFNV